MEDQAKAARDIAANHQLEKKRMNVKQNVYHNQFDPYMSAQLAPQSHARPHPSEWPVKILKQPATRCFNGITVTFFYKSQFPF